VLQLRTNSSFCSVSIQLYKPLKIDFGANVILAFFDDGLDAGLIGVRSIPYSDHTLDAWLIGVGYGQPPVRG